MLLSIKKREIKLNFEKDKFTKYEKKTKQKRKRQNYSYGLKIEQIEQFSQFLIVNRMTSLHYNLLQSFSKVFDKI